MKNLTQVDFTQKVHTMQLKMKFDVETYIPEDSKVQLVCNIVEEMNLSFMLSTYPKMGRKPAVDPAILLKILIFCYSEGIYTSRKIEDFCKYDTRAFFLLEGIKAPDHTTINRFRNQIEGFSADLLTQFVELLVREKHLDLKTLYIDGTKIESVAGRYTFVWRKTVEKYQKRLHERVINELNLPEDSSLVYVLKRVKQEFGRISNACSDNKIVFVYGTGKRKTQYQRDYERLKEMSEKLQQYEEHLRLMGNRNSYSKTDHDATFMRMKEDHMRNGQLKPAYNIQLASSGAFIVGVMGSQKSNDLHTLKPFLEQMMPKYEKYLKNIVTDAGYESVENYAYLDRHSLIAYIKPSNYEMSKSKKYRDDIGKRENMDYLESEDVYICKNGKRLIRGKDATRKYESGYQDILHTYICNECTGCPYSSQCINGRKSEGGSKKMLKFSPSFDRYRIKSHKNITSARGIIHRMNRSIQAEGMFSKLKDGLQYDRFRHRGMSRVVSDVTLMALGINLNKLHLKILKNQSGVIEYKKVA